jgi:hypothetical protein
MATMAITISTKAHAQNLLKNKNLLVQAIITIPALTKIAKSCTAMLERVTQYNWNNLLLFTHHYDNNRKAIVKANINNNWAKYRQ